jgi:outer membrane protein assembly factor BamB
MPVREGVPSDENARRAFGLPRSAKPVRTSGGRGLAVVGALVLAAHAVVLLGTVRRAAAVPWRQPGFSASRSAFSPREIAVSPANVASLVERWRAPGTGVTESIVARAGRVFGSNGAEMVALDLADGSELWRKAIDGGPDCCGVGDPVLTADGRVTAALGWIFGGGSASFDPVTGAFTYGQEFHGGYQYPAVAGGDFFSVGYAYGSGGPLIYTLEPYGGLVFFGGLTNTAVGGLAVLGDRAYVAFGSTLQAFDLTSCPDPIVSFRTFCSPLWTATLAQRIATPVAFRDSVAVVSDDGTLEVHAAADGALEWAATVNAGIGHPPAVARRRIFVPTRRGLIVAFDASGCGSATCMPVQRFHLGSPATGQPVVAGKVLYAGTKDGRVVAFRASGCPEAVCEPLLDVDLGGGAIVAGPIVVDGMVIAATADGQVVALGLPSPS